MAFKFTNEAYERVKTSEPLVRGELGARITPKTYHRAKLECHHVVNMYIRIFS